MHGCGSLNRFFEFLVLERSLEEEFLVFLTLEVMHTLYISIDSSIKKCSKSAWDLGSIISSDLGFTESKLLEIPL